jgi:hypothetical protein
MADAQAHVFYSWQSDLPNATNRGFIQKALENAAKAVRDDNSLHVDPVVDRDTIGVPGSPDIASTIFEKIERAQAFVCDISIISEPTAKRPTPNPNVLLELGYALKTLGPNRILMVFNDAYGGLERLPFDLRTRRVIRYHAMPDVHERSTERKQVEQQLAEGLRAILAGASTPPPGEVIKPNLAARTREAVELGRPDQASLTRTYMAELSKELGSYALKLADVPEDNWYDLLLSSLSQSWDAITEFTRTCQVIAAMNGEDAAKTLYQGLEHVLNLYTLPNAAQERLTPQNFDFAKFVGHEMLVTLTACLIQEGRWTLIADLLARDFYVRPGHFDRKEHVPFMFASQYLLILESQNQRLNPRRMSLHGDLLHERHSQGELGELMPSEQFAEADYFLYLRAELEPKKMTDHITWWPWSALYMTERPRYHVDADSTPVAEQLLRPLGVPDIPTLRERLVERGLRYERNMSSRGFFLHFPMGGFDVNTIGTE